MYVSVCLYTYQENLVILVKKICHLIKKSGDNQYTYDNNDMINICNYCFLGERTQAEAHFLQKV